MIDKYGAGQDPYCYCDSHILKNLLNIRDESTLQEAELDLSSLAAKNLDFAEPPYDLIYLRRIHNILFADIYEWAGAIRTIDISKANTHFCTASRIAPEANKLFKSVKKKEYFVGMDKTQLIKELSELYADLNVIHPFRDGNGRAQRILFEHIVVNCGFEISWTTITINEWLDANIQGFYGNYETMESVFRKCIGRAL